MPKFAIYQYLFGKIKDFQYQLPLYEEDYDYSKVDVNKSWTEKQEIFGRLFEEQSELEFKIPEKVKPYGHQLIACSIPDVIIMRFANNKEETLEVDFQKVKTDNFPSTLVIIDNRKDVQRIAIWSNDAFSDTRQVARIMERVFRDRLKRDLLTIDIRPKCHSSEFWKVVDRTYGRVCYAKFNLMHPNLPELTEGIKELMGLANDMNGDPSIEVKPLEGQITINIPHKQEASPFVQHIVNVCAALHQPINVKTIDGENVDCYIEAEGYDPEKKEYHVVQEVEKSVIYNLNSNDAETRQKATLALVEFMTKLKLFND